MVNTIRCGYFPKIKRIDTFQAADVVGENAWIGATLMVGIYAADFAEIVFGRMCLEGCVDWREEQKSKWRHDDGR